MRCASHPSISLKMSTIKHILCRKVTLVVRAEPLLLKIAVVHYFDVSFVVVDVVLEFLLILDILVDVVPLRND